MFPMFVRASDADGLGRFNDILTVSFIEKPEGCKSDKLNKVPYDISTKIRSEGFQQARTTKLMNANSRAVYLVQIYSFLRSYHVIIRI